VYVGGTEHAWPPARPRADVQQMPAPLHTLNDYVNSPCDVRQLQPDCLGHFGIFRLDQAHDLQAGARVYVQRGSIHTLSQQVVQQPLPLLVVVVSCYS